MPRDQWPFDHGRFDWLGVALAIAFVAAGLMAAHEAHEKALADPPPVQITSEKT